MQLEISQLERKYAHLRIDDRRGQRSLLASVVQQGQQTPVLVVRQSEHRYVLIDGYRRVAALEALACDLVEAVVLPVGEAEGLVLGYRLSRGRRPSALEEGWLLRELIDQHGQKQRDLAALLGRSRSWVSRRLSLVRVLPESVQQAVRQGLVPAQGAMKSLVPLARANSEQCAELVAHLHRERPTVRQLHQLYVAWKCGDSEQRAHLAREPGLYLKAATAGSATRSANDETADAAALGRDLEVLAALCRRCRQRVREGVLSRTRRLSELFGVWREVEVVFGSLSHHMQQEEPDARSRDTDSDPEAARSKARYAQDRPCAGRLP